MNPADPPESAGDAAARTDEGSARTDGGGSVDDWDAVFWDVGGVVLDLASARAAHERFVADLVAEHDLDASPEAALSTWRDAVGDYFRQREGTEYRQGREAYARGVAAVVGERLPESAWRPAFEAAAAAEREPEPGAVETVERLAAADLHLGVLSDVDDDEGRWILDEFGVLDCFDSVTTSEAVGRTKPDPAMFEAALDAAARDLGRPVDPDRALMVGDRYRHDVAGAADAGLRTVAYGADDGPAVDYRVEDLRELLGIVGVE